MNNKTFYLFVILFLLGSCTADTHNLKNCLNGINAGFLQGLWHGIISPITFIVSLFENNVTIYEVQNNGNWYNLGFVLGCYFTFQGTSEGVKKVRK